MSPCLESFFAFSTRQASRKVMAAYRRVDGFKSPAADCLYTGISSWFNAR